MTITDATGSLTTAWTEQSIVSFTAGTLSTVADMRSYIEFHLKRGTLGNDTDPSITQVNESIIRAKQELLSTKSYSYSRRYAQATAVAGTYIYALPPDFQGVKGLRDTTNDRDIVVWSQKIFDIRFPDLSAVSNNEPKVACVKNMELWIWPPPNGAITFELEYERSGDDNTQTDMSWLPQLERFRCCDFAIADCLDALHDERAQIYWQRWAAGIARSMKSDAKKKWRGRNQALSIFQEASARRYSEEPEGGHSS